MNGSTAAEPAAPAATAWTAHVRALAALLVAALFLTSGTTLRGATEHSRFSPYETEQLGIPAGGALQRANAAADSTVPPQPTWGLADQAFVLPAASRPSEDGVAPAVPAAQPFARSYDAQGPPTALR